MHLHKLKSIYQSPWFLALVLLVLFLSITQYKYGWDDQHLEIPLLKNLIDNTYYQGDYYVESLKNNFSSFFYPILSKLITVEQIPAVYFMLYLLSRYFLFFWMYKLWFFISKDPFKAFSCVLVFMLMIRIEEFLYRTFSHQEFALAIIFAGIYFFYKERFLLASVLLGIAANFHALYSLFPMMFICIYLLWQVKKHRFKTLIKCSIVFAAFSLPFIIWVFKNRFSAPGHDVAIYKDWIPLYKLACPQNFFFKTLPQIPFIQLIRAFKIFYALAQNYIFLIILFILNLSVNKDFRKDKKTISCCIGSFALLVLCLIFTYFYPIRFFLDLNLTRNTQFLMFFLMGYTSLLAFNSVERDKPLIAFVFAILFSFLKYGLFIGTCSAGIMFFTLLLSNRLKCKKTTVNYFLIAALTVLLLPCIYGIFHSFNTIRFSLNSQLVVRLNIFIIFALLFVNYLACKLIKNQKTLSVLKKLFIIIPLTVFMFQYGYYRNSKLKAETEGGGFWKLQRNWEDMQRFVKENTPKDSMLLVPYNMEMGGFRIGSERKIVASYRDCGIVGFDYQAALEWQRRIKDIRPFKFDINEPAGTAIRNAIVNYDADYIVFMQHVSPGKDNEILQRVYTNDYFALFKVKPLGLIK